MVKRFAVAFPLALVGAIWAYYLLLPWPHPLRWRDPGRTSLVEYRVAQATARGETLEIRHEWVPLDRISTHLRRAVIVAEDARFYDHAGIDWDALREELRYDGSPELSLTDPDDLRAVWAAVRYYRDNRDRIRGRSTITQQLAKNLYLSPERSLRRKLEELVLTRRIERALPKDRILEIYLNIAEWGPGIFGAEAAARHYFGRSAADMTREQAAALAATLPHPLTSNPAHRPGRMAWRQNLILQRMGATGPVRTVPLELPPEPGIDPRDLAVPGDPEEPAPPVLGEPMDPDDREPVPPELAPDPDPPEPQPDAEPRRLPDAEPPPSDTTRSP